MPALFIRILPLVILLFLGLRYFFMALKPQFKIDYFTIDETKEALLDKIELMKSRVRLKKTAPEAETPRQSVADEGYTVHFANDGIKVDYRKSDAMSNIFLVVALHPELHAKSRFAEGYVSVITLKNAARLKQKYPELLTPRGLRSHIDQEDTEKFYLIYPPQKAAMLKAKLKEAHRAMFTGTERIHMQLKGQMLEYKEGWVDDQPVQTPLTANVLYLQQAELIQAYSNEKPANTEDLDMATPREL